MASIIDKAREYSPDNNESKDAFLNGALWMLEKAVQRFANEVSEFDTLIDKTSEGLINKENTVEKFRKAMEE